jgi:uncharacterized protein YmfQ (DUF2313 family)
MTSLFKKHSQAEMEKVQADFLPNGKAWEGKNVPETNLYKLLYGISGEALRLSNLMNLISSQDDITITTDLITQWESAVGIPDHCFKTNVSLEQRRIQVLVKLALKADTRQSFIDIAALFGIRCEISNPSVITYPLPYPWPYTSYVWASCTLYVDLPANLNPKVYPFTTYHYPWPYSSDETNIIKCIFEEIKQATCQLIFRYIL